MDYTNHICPVCKKAFQKGDDIVVCPICGTPHHRECYEIEMQCHNADKHRDGYDYKEDNFKDNTSADEQTGSVADNNGLCYRCGNKNPRGSKFCNSCGMPLDRDNTREPYDRHKAENTPPHSAENANSTPTGNVPFEPFGYDPMGGVNSEEEIASGVTAGELSKFVKTNTPLYTRIFYSIKNFGRSRFNFAGFFFGGGWMLYRKMYKLGSIFTALMALCLVAQLYVGTFYSDLMNNISELSYGSSFFANADTVNSMQEFIAELEVDEIIALGISYFSSIAYMVIRFIVGACGNRWYYKHCINKVGLIKSTAETKDAADSELQTKGGVNTPLAISLMITYAVISYLPYFF